MSRRQERQEIKLLQEQIQWRDNELAAIRNAVPEVAVPALAIAMILDNYAESIAIRTGESFGETLAQYTSLVERSHKLKAAVATLIGDSLFIRDSTQQVVSLRSLAENLVEELCG